MSILSIAAENLPPILALGMNRTATRVSLAIRVRDEGAVRAWAAVLGCETAVEERPLDAAYSVRYSRARSVQPHAVVTVYATHRCRSQARTPLEYLEAVHGEPVVHDRGPDGVCADGCAGCHVDPRRVVSA